MDIERRPSDKSKEEIRLEFEKLSSEWDLHDGRRLRSSDKPIRLVKPE